MGFFGSLIGWDQSMGAVNAVLASYLIEKADRADRIKIAKEVARIIMSVRPRQTPESLMQELSNDSRVIQMNFIALACDNLGIPPPVPNNVWTRIKNPYQLGKQIDELRISSAVDAIKRDGVSVVWPGNNVSINFKTMYEEGTDQNANNQIKRPQNTTGPSSISTIDVPTSSSPLPPGHALEAWFPEDSNNLPTTQDLDKISPTVHKENKRIYSALSAKYFAENIGLDESYDQIRKNPQVGITELDREAFGDDLVDFFELVARHEFYKFRYGTSNVDLPKNEDYVEAFGKDLITLIQRVAQSVVFDHKELFIDQNDLNDFGEDFLLLMYRIAMYVYHADEETVRSKASNLSEQVYQSTATQAPVPITQKNAVPKKPQSEKGNKDTPTIFGPTKAPGLRR